MDIWMRLIGTIFSCLWKSRIAPTDSIETNYIVGITEADASIMSNARYLLFMELARLEMMIRTGVLKAARRHRWLPLVASQTIRYKRPLKRFQAFSLKSRVVGWNEKWFFVEQIFSRKGKVSAFGMVKCCFRSKDGLVQPETVFKEIGYIGSAPVLPSCFLEWANAEDQQEQAISNQS